MFQLRTTSFPLLLALAGIVLGGISLFIASPVRGEDPGSGGRGHVYTATGNPPERTAWTGDDSDVRGAFVHGTDDRERLRDTHEFPLSAYVYLELYDEWGFELGSCTGVFIGPDAILTAAHCLWDSLDGWTGDIAVVPGKDGAIEPFGQEWATTWWVPDEWIDTGGQDDFDWGIVRLGSTTLSDQTGYLGISVLTDETLERPDIGPAIVGYPGDKPEGTLWGAMVDSFLWVDAFELIYDIDTYSGQSGSPILLLGDTEFQGSIVGVHTWGGNLGNGGIRIDREVLVDIDNACVQMECTFEYYVEDDETAPPTAVPTSTSTPTTAAATATPTSTRASNTATPVPTQAVPSERGQYAVLAPGLVSNATGSYAEPAGGQAPVTPTPTATPTRTASATPATSTATPTTTPVTPVPTAVSTRVVAPVTPTPTGGAGAGTGILGTIDGWYAQVEDFSDRHLAIVDAANSDLISESNAAAQLESLAYEAFGLGDAIEAGAAARASWPLSCQLAADWTGISAGWQGVLSGYWSLLFYEWPYGDYFADIDYALDELFIARTNAIESRYYCATGGQATTMQTLPTMQ